MMTDSELKSLEATWDRCERILSRIDRMTDARKRRYGRIGCWLESLQDRIGSVLPVAMTEF